MWSVQSPPSNRWATLYPELIYHCLSGAATLDICSPGLFPWHLGHVCTLWRSVFISSPRFWDRFAFEVLEVEKVTIDRLKRAVTLVKLCVKCTRDRPFSFRFNARTWTDGATIQSPHPSQILEIKLVAHADRWSTVYIAAEGLAGVEELLLKAKHRFGQLHTLQISMPFETSYDLDLFEDAPSLIRVYTIDYHRLRWSSITVLHIEFTSTTTSRLFTELDKMTCLEELVIQMPPFLNEDALPVIKTPVEMPSLKTFYVQHNHLVSLIRAPSLERLHLIYPLRKSYEPIVETFLRKVSHLKYVSPKWTKRKFARVIMRDRA
ncbi:hypothetical protein F5887DRAFT_1082347 [Amanita rubescens]|nr:hypothetical protein F5887DRAFT_1082347 [Amanita rubescens]